MKVAKTTNLIPSKGKEEEGRFSLDFSCENNPTKERIDKIIELLNGLSLSEAEQILNATKASLPFRSYVQPVKVDQL